MKERGSSDVHVPDNQITSPFLRWGLGVAGMNGTDEQKDDVFPPFFFFSCTFTVIGITQNPQYKPTFPTACPNVTLRLGECMASIRHYLFDLFSSHVDLSEGEGDM